MSGFVFDAKAARAAIAARRAERDKAAVCAVVAVDGRATVQEPQEPRRAAIASDEIAFAIEERAALAAESVPACYLDAWARLQCQRPLSVAESDWRRAIDDGGRFLDAWGADAAAKQWGAGELFDVPLEDRPGGLVWQLRGEGLDALGEDRARLADGRTIKWRAR